LNRRGEASTVAFFASPGQRPALAPRGAGGWIDMTDNDVSSAEPRQLLHLVFGGELKSVESQEFRDPSKIDVVGIFPNYASAERAWRAKAQSTVDSAQTRYFIVHLHRFLEPSGLKRNLA
jgi:hypothetical protein